MLIDVIDIKTPPSFAPRQLVLFDQQNTEERIAWFTTALPESKDRPALGSLFFLTGTVKRQGSHAGIPQTEVVGVTLAPVG